MAWPSEAATAQLLADLADGLATRGWEVHVIAGGTGPAPSDRYTIHRTGGTERHSGPLAQLRNYAEFLRASRATLATHIRAGDVVVALTDPPQLASTLAPVVRKAGARLIVWVQDLYPDILLAHVGRWLAPFLYPLTRERNRAWRASDQCVAVSEEMRRRIVAAGVPESATATIPNWAPVDLDHPPAPEDVARVRARWNVSQHLVVAYSGNLGRVHQFDAILGAAQILQHDADLRFVFVGAGPRLPEVRAEVVRRKLENVSFEPPEPRANLAPSLAAADLHLVSLRPGFEALVFPSKFAGILAAGRPTLFAGPPGSSITSFVDAQRCGLAVRPGDADGLAAAIRELRLDPERRRAMGVAARHAYTTHYTFSSALASWSALVRGSGR
ncbi:MAG TPA: glycosyltransferase family 4 protein [Candidatus Didemnitutus sp.]|nr:glycosyltransferase family 4 protein [Candidatus Didemnitutus sp.]